MYSFAIHEGIYLFLVGAHVDLSKPNVGNSVYV